MATSMSSNKLVWVGVAVLAVLVVAAVINSSNDPEEKTPAQMKQEQRQAATNNPVAVSVDGDTVVESIKELSARYEKVLMDNKSLEKRVQDQASDLNKLKQKSSYKNSSKSDPMVGSLQNQMAEMKSDFQMLTKNLQKKAHSQMAVENGYEVTSSDLGWTDEGEPKTNSGHGGYTAQSQSLPGYMTVRPMTRSQLLSSDPKLADRLLKDRLSNASGSTQDNGAKSGLKNTLKNPSSSFPLEDVTPYYTIPARGTIFKAKAMTAIIGTVPLGGRIQDPFPAKFVVGAENLATNGLHIPGLKGIVFEGQVRGNWNLSCSAVTITAGTYTFSDGRIQHMIFDQKKGGGSGNRSAQSASPFAENESSAGLGYITNRQGVPCIPGKRVTDAQKQLFTMGVLGAAKSYFDAKAAVETTTNRNVVGGDSTSVTGDKGAFVANETYGNTIETAMDFYSKRMRDTFDAIYTDPGAEVSINITQDLYIDYDKNARKLAYTTGGNNAHKLD